MNNCLNFFYPITVLTLSALASPCQAITWQYFDTHADNGTPKTLVDLSTELPPTLVADVLKRLPERLNIKNNDPKLLTDNLGANIQLLDDAEISVAYVTSQAGYENSLGFFAFNPASMPKAVSALNTKILFPRLPSWSSSLLKFGQAVKLGKFKGGMGVGFTLVSNGWSWSGYQVNPNQPGNTIFQTIKELNPEPAGLNAHTVLLSKPEDGIVVLGFEDINRNDPACDHDFNDAIIAIKVTPFSAINRSQMSPLSKIVKDTDADTVQDNLDAFPLDPTRAARRFYPSANGYGHLAFEDNWPKKGDFDMNDLAVDYRAIETLNAQNQITDLKLIYNIVGRGAQNDNAFAIHLPGVQRSAINQTTSLLTVASQPSVPLLPESGQSEAVFIMTSSANSLTPTGMGWPCGFFNTVSTCPRLAAVPLVAEIHFNQPLTRGQMASAPYNPFIYPNRYAGRGMEVHLVDHPPTAKADPKYFGTYDDATNPSQGKYYRTTDKQFWALDIPETWLYPAEWNNISNVYLTFPSWSAGISNLTTTNWFVSNINAKLIFKP
ncbi:MAG: LruC domain-containing protein [Methylococcaceae bacterium]